MKAVSLDAKVREITGKKVKKLRREGMLPVGVYGKGVKSMALSVGEKEFLKVYGQAGETGLVELKFGGKSLHTLISNVQIHPVNRKPLHVEFHAVSLTEKIKANVPLELTGESPAVVNNMGLLLQPLSEVEVEALPADLPEKINVDVTGLAEVDQQIAVGDIPALPGVAILTATSEIVVKVVPAVSEETQKELAAEEAAKVAAAAEAAPAAEGAVPSGEAIVSEGEIKKEEAPKEEKAG